MTLDDELKQARMTGERDFFNGGVLQIVASDGGVLASVTLNTPSGTVAGAGVLTLAGFPKTATASAGTAASARVRNSAGKGRNGLSVGIPGSGAQVVIDVKDSGGASTNSLAIPAGATVTISASPTVTHAA